MTDKDSSDSPDFMQFAEVYLGEYDAVQDSQKITGRATAYVAAGPLENLFVYHGYEVINAVKEKADCSEKFQLALSGVWLDEDDDAIFPHWRELMKQYNFIGDNPRQRL